MSEGQPNAGTPFAQSPGGALWASAFVLAALVIIQAGRVFSPVAAPGGADGRAAADVIASLFESRAGAAVGADVVSHVGPYAVMTFDGGNEDVLAVLDSRGEDLYSYRVNQSRLEFLGRESVRDIFTNARLTGAGTGRR